MALVTCLFLLDSQAQHAAIHQPPRLKYLTFFLFLLRIWRQRTLPVPSLFIPLSREHVHPFIEISHLGTAETGEWFFTTSPEHRWVARAHLLSRLAVLKWNKKVLRNASVVMVLPLFWSDTSWAGKTTWNTTISVRRSWHFWKIKSGRFGRILIIIKIIIGQGCCARVFLTLPYASWELQVEQNKNHFSKHQLGPPVDQQQECLTHLKDLCA